MAVCLSRAALNLARALLRGRWAEERKEASLLQDHYRPSSHAAACLRHSTWLRVYPANTWWMNVVSRLRRSYFALPPASSSCGSKERWVAVRCRNQHPALDQ